MKPIQLFDLDALEKHTPIATPVAASYTIGAGANGEVLITNTTAGIAGNNVRLSIVLPTEADEDLTAVVTEGVLIITLGTDSNGDPDDTKNTATLIAAAIEAISGDIEFTAVASGDGSTPLTEGEATVYFEGGADCTPMIQGQACYDNSYIYLAIGNNTTTDSSNIKKIALASL